MQDKISKQEAVELWSKFIENKRVIKSAGYWMGGYMQFILTLPIAGKKKEVEITLVAKGAYSHEAAPREITEDTMKDLQTPYGEFMLSAEEAQRCRSAWLLRDEKKEHIAYNKLIIELGKT